MSKKVAIVLADGFEPVEAIAPADALRRSGASVDLVSIMPSLTVRADQNITVTADVLAQNAEWDTYDAILIPGGAQGVENLKKSAIVAEQCPKFMANKLVFSICAGPTVLNELGLLEGYKATCYPGCEAGFPAGVYQEGLGVVADKNLVTASGPGQALAFGVACVDALLGGATAHEVAGGMLIGGY